jgi:radical SAM superfamily enzyme YgiQ (UPF0313 family)
MEKPRIVLVAIDSGDGGEHVPLGAGCIAAALSESGAAYAEDIAIFQLRASDSDTYALEKIRGFKPAVVGFSLNCWSSPRAIRLAEILSRDSLSPLLIAGGPDAEALLPRSGLPFHTVFLGEGEETVVAWLGARAAEASPGTPTATRFIRGAPCSAAELPSPWLAHSVIPAKGGSVAWELTRGCPYHCAYCYEGRGEAGVRHIPRARLERELALFEEKKVSEVFVLDPTFNIGKERTLDLLRLFSEKGKGIHWNIEIRAELLDPKQASAFSKLDCSLQIGLQSAHAEVLKRIGRDIDKKEFVRKISYLNSQGVVFGLDLIYGLPGDTLRGFRESLDFALSLRPNHMDIFPLAVLPGTELFDRKDELKLSSQPDPPYLAAGTADFPAGDLASARLLAESCAAFYSEGRAVPWFLSVLAPLNMSAASFLDGFSLGKGLPHALIEDAQCEWISRKYAEEGKASYLALALDLVRYYGAWSRAFAEKTPTSLNLSYPLELVESPEALKLASALRHWKPKPDKIEIQPSRDGPRVRKLR